ncbi:hypothetical protein D9M69_664280 [compost metagenome]
MCSTPRSKANSVTTMPRKSSQLQVGVPRKSAARKVNKVSMMSRLCSKALMIRIGR